MLKAALWVEFIMSGKVDFPIFPDNPGLGIGQDLGVEMLPLRRQFRIAKRHCDAVIARPLEQRRCGSIGHGSLEPAIDLGLILKIPARKEGGQAELGKDDEFASGAVGFIQQGDHA